MVALLSAPLVIVALACNSNNSSPATPAKTGAADTSTTGPKEPGPDLRPK
jgi:hypothetical protein